MTNNRASILIASHTHLCRNPRVLKEALTLSKAGYQVTVATAVYDNALLEEDLQLLTGSNINYHYYSDLRKITLTSFKQKLIRKAALILQQKWGKELADSLGYGFSALKRYCLSKTFDLYIMHQELPLLAGIALLKKGKKVAFDLEDWYSEDLLPEVRSKRPIKLLKHAEKYVLQNGKFCLTTSKSMAHKLAEVYNSTTPSVIYNSFPSTQLTIQGKDYSDTSLLKLFWFSQTIGPGRGLEDFISLTAFIDKPLEIHLQGAVSTHYQQSLQHILPHNHRLFFHELIPNEALPQQIVRFDIGLALEPLQPSNKDLTISNKFFQYIQAGLPVVATRTAGQIEAFEKFQPGILINLPAGEEDIAALNDWLNNVELLKKSAQAAQNAAKEYNWENESMKLLQIVKKALDE